MLIWTTHFSRKKAVASVVIMGIVMAVLICLAGRDEPETTSQQPLTNHPQRIAYLESFGWQVDPDPLETLQFLMPEPLEEPYLSYNELQKKQGFDLSLCCGKQITRYTYAVTNYPAHPEGVQVNLYLCEDLPVAGDIFRPGTNGFQTTLQYPAGNKA